MFTLIRLDIGVILYYKDMNTNKRKYFASSVNLKKYGKWVNFYYQKRFIWFGKVISKRTFGFNGVLYL